MHRYIYSLASLNLFQENEMVLPSWKKICSIIKSNRTCFEWLVNTSCQLRKIKIYFNNYGNQNHVAQFLLLMYITQEKWNRTAIKPITFQPSKATLFLLIIVIMENCNEGITEKTFIDDQIVAYYLIWSLDLNSKFQKISYIVFE